jgi:hypothetical protein
MRSTRELSQTFLVGNRGLPPAAIFHQLPSRRLFEAQVAQLVPVVLDQLAGHDRQPGQTTFESPLEHARQLRRKARRRREVGGAVGLVQRHAGFRRIRHHQLQRRRLGHLQHLVPLRSRIDRPADARHLDRIVEHLALPPPANQYMVARPALVERRCPVAFGRLNDDDPADVLPPLVGLVDEQVDEGAEEIAGAKLEDSFGERSSHGW